MTPPSRSRAGALLLTCYLATGLAAPVAHQAWHRPDHVHGQAVVPVGGLAQHGHDAAAGTHRPHPTAGRFAVAGPVAQLHPPQASRPDRHPHPHRHPHDRAGRAAGEGPHDARDGAPDPPPPAPRAEQTAHHHGPPEVEAEPSPPGSEPAPAGAPRDPDHGQGSIAHFALAMIGAPATIALPAPADAVAAPPAYSYASRCALTVRPRAARAPPA